MATLEEAEARMREAETALRPYESPELWQQTRQAVQREWTPILQRSVGETERMMREFLPRFMEIPYQGLAAGTTAASLTPQQKMSLMGTELGGLAGRLSAASTLSDVLGGRASEMQSRALQAAQLGQQGAAQAYSRAFQRYQMLFQAAEADKARAAAAARAAVAQPRWPTLPISMEVPPEVGAGAGAQIVERPGVAERLAGMAEARGIEEDLLRNMAAEIAQTVDRNERAAIYRKYMDMIPYPQRTPQLQRQMQAIATGRALY